MSMDDWYIQRAADPFVYYLCRLAQFAAVHFTRNALDVFEDHMTTQDRLYYYYGNTPGNADVILGTSGAGNFNTDQIPYDIAKTLYDAWKNYYQ